MLALRNFIQFGVAWKCQDELDQKEDLRFINSRAAKIILRSLADLTKVKSPTKGVKTGREGLSGFVYQRSTVSDTLKRLIELGVVNRKRGKNKGSIHEDFATTYIVPDVISAALAWQKECRILKKMGKRGDEAKPVKKILIRSGFNSPPLGASETDSIRRAL